MTLSLAVALFSFSYLPQATAGGSCGDEIVAGFGEVCDDGNNVDGDGCSADCTTIEIGYNCDIAVEPSVCEPICGDGLEVGDEICDDGNADNTDACLDTCEEASCGDGFVEAGVEECDDGNLVDGDGCDSFCVEEIADDLTTDFNEVSGSGCALSAAAHVTSFGSFVGFGLLFGLVVLRLRKSA